MLPALLLFISLAASAMSQYWQKRTALSLENTPLAMHNKAKYKPLLLSVLFLAVAAISWLGVLSFWDVSDSYPLLSINFIVMLFVSRYAFNETISKLQVFGIAAVVFGVILIASGLS